MKVKGTEQLLRQVRTLTRDKILLSKQIAHLERKLKESERDKVRLVADWSKSHDVITRRNRELQAEIAKLTDSNNYAKGM